MEEIEEWKDIPGFEGMYQASTLGNIKSLKCGRNSILSPYHRKDGYLSVALCKNSKSETLLIHRIVAITFLENTEGLTDVNHVNGIKSDNRLENLEWLSHQKNVKHSFENLGRKASTHMKGKSGKLHNRSKEVHKLDLSLKFLESFGSAREAARMIGFPNGYGNIINVCLGNKNQAYGFIWRYVD